MGLKYFCLLLAAAFICGCSSPERGAALPVGSPCDQDHECAGPGTPVCLEEFKPLADLIDPGADPDQKAFFENIGFDFPGGYCSTLENCHQDSECGQGGECFWPLKDVSVETLQSLQDAGLPFDIFDFADMGLCMRRCRVDDECREGYECAIPLESFLILVTGSSDETFCVPIDPCYPDPCDHGTCSKVEGEVYSCECDAGYTGDDCEINIDDCDPNPCQNGGTCTDGVDSYGCQCPTGYTGDNCETEVVGCDPNPCQNGGTCQEVAGGYQCTCPAGYSGDHCETDIDDCATNPCQNGGTCVDGVDSYTCQCAAGFTGDDCEINIDECAANPCLNGGTCIDGVDSYTCQCVAGYTGDDCEINIDDCDPDPCQNGGTCVDGVNSYTCQCPAGYTGTNCETPVSGCDPNPCQNGGTCTDEGGGAYSCQCQPGYTGTHCETNIDDCASNPCQNGGLCIDGVGSYTCQCQPGYTGDNCEIDIDECASNPCQNGGVCVDGVNSYTCQCQPGYTGANCENLVDCGDPPQILDGDVSYTTTTFGSTATYTCLPGSTIDPPGGETIACQADGTWETPPACLPDAQVQNPGPVVFEFPVAVMVFTDTTGFDFDTTGNPECSDGANNDDFTAAGEGIQDSDIDFPDDAECSEAADDSECKTGFQDQITMTLTGTIDADGNINIPMAGVVIPPVYGYSDQLGGDHVSLNTFIPTHDAAGALDPATGEVAIRIRFRLRFQGGTSDFNGPGNNCYIGTTTQPIDITITSGTSTSAQGKPDLTGVAYEATGGTLSLAGYNTADIPGAATCGFLGFGNGAINDAFGTPSGAGHVSMEVSGSTTPILIIP